MSLTSPALVEAYVRRTGLPMRQALTIVARCALVKHLAERHGDRFILKGGALLHHVYRTPRVSFLDTDYAEVKTRGNPDIVELEKDLLFEDTENSISLKTTPAGRWSERGYIVKGERLTFTFSDFSLRGTSNTHVNISVSFRRSERLEVPDQPLLFDPLGLLSDPTSFEVPGLTLNEIAAEKILAWCLKDELYKHLADLAILARDHDHELEISRVMDLLREKFSRESRSPETKSLYSSQGLSTPADLNRRFLPESRIQLARKQWASSINAQIWLQASERAKSNSIANIENVLSLVQNYWEEGVGTL